MRLGIPAERAGQRADGGDDEQADKGGIPAVGLNELAQTYAGKGRAGVTEEAGQADGGGGGALGGEVGRGNADEALRAVNEEARAAEQQGVEPDRLAPDSRTRRSPRWTGYPTLFSRSCGTASASSCSFRLLGLRRWEWS